MKKLSFLCVVLFLFFLCKISAKVYKNSWLEMGLKGQITSFIESTYSAEVKAGKTVKSDLLFTQQAKFDSKGMMVVIVFKPSKGDSIKYLLVNEGELQMELIAPTFTTKNIRNKSGEVIEEQTYSHKGKLLRRTEYTYDSDGNCIEEKLYGKSECLRVTEMKYDSKGNVIEAIVSGDEDMRTESKYNKHNLVVKEETFDGENNKINAYTYEYVFDNHGNWINKKKIVGDFPVEIVERELIYAASMATSLSKDVLLKKVSEYFLLLVLIAMVAHMLYVLYKGKRFKTVFTANYFKSLRDQSDVDFSDSENRTEQAYELLNRAFLEWTVVGGEDGIEYRKPTKMKQIKSSIFYLEQVINMNPEDEDVIKSLNEYTDVINSAEMRSFYGSKAIIVIGILVAAFFAFTDSGSGGFVKEFFTGGFMIWGPVIVYVLASRKPKFLIDKKLDKSGGVKSTSGVAAMILGIIGGAHTVRTVTKWSDGSKSVDDDHSQYFFAWVIAFLVMIVIAAFMWLWAIFNYLRNYVLYF